MLCTSQDSNVCTKLCTCSCTRLCTGSSTKVYTTPYIMKANCSSKVSNSPANIKKKEEGKMAKGVREMVGEWETIIMKNEVVDRPVVKAKRRVGPKDLNKKVQLGMEMFLTKGRLFRGGHEGAGEGHEGGHGGGGGEAQRCDGVQDGGVVGARCAKRRRPSGTMGVGSPLKRRR